MTAFYKVGVKHEDGSIEYSINDQEKADLEGLMKSERDRGLTVVSAELLVEGDYGDLLDEIYGEFVGAGAFAEMGASMSDRLPGDVNQMSHQQHEKLANDLIELAALVKEKMEKSLKLLSFLQCSPAPDQIEGN